VHVQVLPAEEIRFDDHVMQVERSVLDTAANFPVRSGEPARVRNHADLPRRLRGTDDARRIGKIQAHRNFDLNVLAH